MGEILNKAIVYAVKAHNGQVRKGTQVPYILHPLEAASIVGTLTTDEKVIAAAVLHDVVEDTAATTECIQEAFWERIAALVAAESENKREDLPAGSTWKIRKQETIDHLRDASIEVKMLTLGESFPISVPFTGISLFTESGYGKDSTKKINRNTTGITNALPNASQN